MHNAQSNMSRRHGSCLPGAMIALGIVLPLSAAYGAAEFRIENGVRIIVANGLPSHQTGGFPNRHNPNTIRTQRWSFRMPLQPQLLATPAPLGMSPFGIALNGVLFDPGTAETWNGNKRWHQEALSGLINLGLDRNNAHVQPNGSYHYHGLPVSLIAQRRQHSQPTLLGYAADGFPIYDQWGFGAAKRRGGALQSSYRLRRGYRPAGRNGPGGRYSGLYTADYEYIEGLGDLDQCNARMGITPEYPQGTYYYVLTNRFPHVPRCFHARPDPSFQIHKARPVRPRDESRRERRKRLREERRQFRR